MLDGRRALDLTDEKGFLCGKILADMGADVIKIEKPGGKDSGRIGPYWADAPDPEKSLYWFAYNTNKRGITLDIETESGRGKLKRLIATADFLIESYPPGWLESIGLGLPALMQINPDLIVVSITPFGQKGPYKDFKASDLVVMGMSGLLGLTGDADRAPLNISIPQSYLLAGADGAVGALMALYHRNRTGMTQHVDVSMQQSASWFLAFTIPTWEMNRRNLTRSGVFRSNAQNARQRQIWPCKDGFVAFFILGGLTGARTSRLLIKWMEDEGMGDEYLRNMDWENFDMSNASQEVLDRIAGPVSEFLLSHTRKEILDAAIKRNIMICSLSSMDDLLNDRSLKERDFWIYIDHLELGVKIPYPRHFARMSEATISTRYSAPLIGEHNDEVFADMDLQEGGVREKNIKPAVPSGRGYRDDEPLLDKKERNIFSGVVIAGFSAAMVGPLSTKMFADYGATVIRIESNTRPCVSRTSPPFKDGKPGLNRSGYFNHFNGNSYSMVLNMKNPLSLKVAGRLISRSDIVMENNRPGVMERWGLGYEEIKKIKQDIIMVRQNGFGMEGPYRDFGSYGMTLAAIAGIQNFIGWPDREPMPVGVGAFTDCISPRYAAAALIKALMDRDRTGKGQLIELVQFETAVSFILPGILDYIANRREPVLMGNSNPYASPHNVYPCKGNDKWCAIAVFDEAQWVNFCRVIDKPEWAEAAEFRGIEGRKKNEKIIDEITGEFTKKFNAEEVMQKMQAAGVPAGVVRDAEGLYNDPQLKTRNIFWPIEHREIGTFTHLGTSFELSKTPGRPMMPAPCIGEHTEYICTNMLGFSDEEFVDLLQEGVFE